MRSCMRIKQSERVCEVEGVVFSLENMKGNSEREDLSILI